MRKDPRDSRAWRTLSKAILARDGYVCGYCGQPATTTDHIESIDKDPTLAMSRDNLIASCRPCNSRKGNRSQAAFLASKFTPLALSTSLSPETAITAQPGPCIGQPEQDLKQ